LKFEKFKYTQIKAGGYPIRAVKVATISYIDIAQIFNFQLRDGGGMGWEILPTSISHIHIFPIRISYVTVLPKMPASLTVNPAFNEVYLLCCPFHALLRSKKKTH